MGQKRVFDTDEGEVEPEVAEPSAPVEKKKKALPSGYVCKACGMVDDHAIYNCTLAIKKTKEEKKKNSEKQVEAQLAEPETAVTESKAELETANSTVTTTSNPNTVFITGLPFKITRNKVIDIFQKEGFASDIGGKDVKLVMFEDKPDKCRGLAYVTFRTEEDYNKGLALSGIEMEGRTLQIIPCAPFVVKGGDAGKSNVKGAFKGRGKLPEGVVKIPRCYRCGALHDPNTCSNPRICYRCKGTDHLSSQCPHKKPKN